MSYQSTYLPGLPGLPGLPARVDQNIQNRGSGGHLVSRPNIPITPPGKARLYYVLGVDARLVNFERGL